MENGSVRRMNRGDKNASRGRRVATRAVCLSISVGPADAVRFRHAGGVSAVQVGQGRDLVRDPRGVVPGRLPRRTEDVEWVSLTCPEYIDRSCDVS